MKFYEEPVLGINLFDKENILTASIPSPTPTPGLDYQPSTDLESGSDTGIEIL